MRQLTPRGGQGEPLVLVHGLMGRGSTWSRQLPWLIAARRGVHLRRTVAPRPRRRRPVSDQHRAVRGRPGRRGGRAGPAGHSDRALDGRAALVVPGGDPPRAGQCVGHRGHGAGLPGPHHRSVGAMAARACRSNSIRLKRFTTSSAPSPGQYFLDAFDRTATGWRLHGHPKVWIEIAAEWGTRDYWEQWKAVRVTRTADRGGQLGHAAGADAPNGRKPATGQRICTCPVPVT